MINPDIFGYYTVGDFKTYRKLEAIEAHARTGIHPTWVFNDDVYGAIDWLTEPAHTLKELYHHRALQLREKYDYLVLWYSGGADSDTVLNSFVDNGILIDEVASTVNYAATSDKYDFGNGEIFNVAAPKIKKLQQQFPSMKYRVIDVCQDIIDYFGDSSISQDWMYDVNTITAGINAARQYIHRQVPEWQIMFEQGKRVGFITGTDKPRLHQTDDEHYHFRFMDMFDNSVTAGQQCRNPEWFNPEFFFWSPDAPLIVVKQGHVVKKFLRHVTKENTLLTETSNGLAFKNIDNKKYWLTVGGMHRLIYPGWQPIPYQVKNLYPLLAQRENWFRKLPNDNQAIKIYKSGLLNRWKAVPDYWKNSKFLRRGYKASVSRSYDLGK